MIKDLEIPKEFKTTEEIIDFFGKHKVFEFNFCSGESICYNSLVPEYSNGQLCDFEIYFYNENGIFYRHDSISEILGGHKLEKLVLVNKENHERKQLFFQRYDENK